MRFQDSLYIIEREKIKSGGGIWVLLIITVKRRPIFDIKMSKQFGSKSASTNLNVQSSWEAYNARLLPKRPMYDIDIEANIENVHLLNKETIIVSDINIDYRKKSGYDKHGLAKGISEYAF